MFCFTFIFNDFYIFRLLMLLVTQSDKIVKQFCLLEKENIKDWKCFFFFLYLKLTSPKSIPSMVDTGEVERASETDNTPTQGQRGRRDYSLEKPPGTSESYMKAANQHRSHRKYEGTKSGLKWDTVEWQAERLSSTLVMRIQTTNTPNK